MLHDNLCLTRLLVPGECPCNAKCSSDSECSGTCHLELKCFKINARSKSRCLTNDFDVHPGCIKPGFH